MYTSVSSLEQAVSFAPIPTFIDELIHTAVFSEDTEIRQAAQKALRTIAQKQGIVFSATKYIYNAIGHGKLTEFTVPAINIRAMTYDIAYLIFTLMKKHLIGLVIFEIARSEMEYTKQDQEEFALCVLAGALKIGYTGPIFLQADHYQVRKKHFAENPQEEIELLKKLISDALTAGFYNIDIDASTLVDLSQPTIAAQQKDNIEITTQLAQFVLDTKPSSQEVTIGAEIGHIGDTNSTQEDLIVFMDGIKKSLPEHTITKLSIQTGTSHGGNVLPDGTLKQATVDFGLLDSLGMLAKEKYGLAGVVQHGASTLPLSDFTKFPLATTLEIHLSTALQNIVYNHLPNDAKQTLYDWIATNCANDRKPDWTDEQFYYKTRKKALGPNKKLLWDLTPEEKEPILHALTAYFEALFEGLQIVNTREKIQAYY
ncbi:class II fructose-bisphosphate aldolase [soil metagenome]